MKKIFFVTVLGLISSPVLAQTTIVPPTCEELGYIYTETDCGDKETVKCPFGDGLYCDLSTVKTCDFGDLIYPDKRCFSASPPDETPLGIIIDPVNRIALALDIEENSASSYTPDYNAFFGKENSASSWSTLVNEGKLKYSYYGDTYNTTPWNTPCYNDSTYDSTAKFPTDAASYMNAYVLSSDMLVHKKCTAKGENWSVPAIGAFVYWRNSATSAQKIAFEETLASISKPSVTKKIHNTQLALDNKYYVSHIYCATSYKNQYPYFVKLTTDDGPSSATMELTSDNLQTIELNNGSNGHGAFLRCVLKY